MPKYFIEDIDSFKETYNECFLYILPGSLTEHWVETNVMSIFIYDLIDKQQYIVNCKHSDFPTTKNLINLKDKLKGDLYIYNKNLVGKFFPNAYDVNLLYWLKYNEKIDTDLPTEIKEYYKWYPKKKTINAIIPISLWISYIRNLKIQFQEICDKTIPGADFYNHGLNLFSQIEKNKIRCNLQILSKFHPYTKNYLLNHYNFYTSTGRPSNSYGNINLAALDKASGIRKSIIPSENNNLIEFDYDAMHIRLIANLLRVPLPSSNLHTYFGRLYFKTPILDKETLQKSKNLTFRFLYGTIDKEFTSIPFFKAADDYKTKIWNEFNLHGKISMPISNREIIKDNFNEPLNKNKLFNYVIQGLETEHNILIIGKILKYLYNKSSRLILYTYDSFLFDINDQDENIINDLSMIFTEDLFKVKIKSGNNYHNMNIWNLKS